MSTKSQVQVKVTPKTKPSRLAGNSVSLTPALNKDAAVSKPGSSRPRSVPGIAPAPATVPTRRDMMVEFGYLAGKRIFDLVVGSFLLMVAMPIVLIAAIAIRMNTPGSPFFFQTRLGKDGKPFRIFKLRGMYIDARERFPAYYDYSAKRDLEFCFHHQEDPRVTSAGRFIRKTSIDELPNLWNVVMGDMSLVGPRPEIPEVLELYGPYREQYLSVKPGVTCLSKCTGRDRLTKRETIEFDLKYIRNRSFRRDLTILWQTFRSVILRRDVF
jgi:lipopolysaccharide/colanic/teichoic acid biosynthesis glycosyltransferase